MVEAANEERKKERTRGKRDDRDERVLSRCPCEEEDEEVPNPFSPTNSISLSLTYVIAILRICFHRNLPGTSRTSKIKPEYP